MALAPGARLGAYEVVALIGAGGMGEVYRARDPRLGRDVAIKVLPAGLVSDPERLHRFEQEARAAAALSHPNILAVFDIGQHNGAPYIVSELLDGETMRERLSGGALPGRKAVEYAVQIAHDVAAGHETTRKTWRSFIRGGDGKHGRKHGARLLGGRQAQRQRLGDALCGGGREHLAIRIPHRDHAVTIHGDDFSRMTPHELVEVFCQPGIVRVELRRIDAVGVHALSMDQVDASSKLLMGLRRRPMDAVLATGRSKQALPW